MNAVEIIRKKRDGGELTDEELAYFIKGYLANNITDYQMAAFLMAAFLQGLTDAETQSLTKEMLYSGDRLDFSYLPEKKVDKHSTGGVGDKTSLVIAPIAAAAGLRVPMISGRALGHTGGTLDKLESIPGYQTNLSEAQFRQIIDTVGVAIIGQTAEIAPADKRIYALRDVTATIEAIPLITASIMSKKLAEGLDALILDVKAGNGAFMKSMAQARILARSMVAVGKLMGKNMAALITEMNQPLGWAVGNSLEVMEAIEVLQGAGGSDLRELCLELAGAMLHLGGVAKDIAEGRTQAANLIASGQALAKFREMVVAQGGNPAVIEDFSLLPQASYRKELTTKQAGYVTSIDTETVGKAAMRLGAGRQNAESVIDYGVGLRVQAKLGDYLAIGQPFCTLYYNDETLLSEAQELLIGAFHLGSEPPFLTKLIREIIL